MTIARISAAALLASLAACGKSGNAALEKQFNYGAPVAPTTSETSAANGAQTNLSNAKSFSSQADASKGFALVAFADSLAEASLGETSIPGLRASADITQPLRDAASLDTCATVTATSVTFNNCTVSESGFNLALSGNVSVSNKTVTWDIHANFSGSEQGISFNISHNQSGSFSVTDTRISGQAISDFGGNISGQGQSVDFGLATAAIVDLSYQTEPFCVNNGSIEVKRVWSKRPNGASGPPFTDAGLKLSWTGCNAFAVAHST